MRIYLIRHGETVWNAARILQLPETPLSERGFDQARRVAERLRSVPLQRILTSDYARAYSTAESVHAATGAPLEVEPLLRERDLGDHRGTPFDELTVDVFAQDYHPPNGESWSEFHARVREAWDAVERVASATDGDFAVVSHALVCRSLVDRCVSLPEFLRPDQIRFGNTAVTIIDGPPWEVVRLGCTAHLGADQVTFPNHPPGV